jgi:hypothetical protein
MGDAVVRTVWLALICLFGVAMLLVVRTIMPASAKIEASVQSEETVLSIPERALKGDRLPVFEPATTKLPTTKIAPVALNTNASAVQAPKIISRHWHDPFDRKPDR